MLEHYIRDPKILAAMRQNYLAPYLEKIAERYYVGGYHFKASKRTVKCAFWFAEWLGRIPVPPDRITAKHVDQFVRWYAYKPLKKHPCMEIFARVAARLVWRQVLEEYPPVVTRTALQAEADRYADHLRRNRGLAESTVKNHQYYLEQFLTFCFRRRPIEPSAITAKRIHTYVNALPYGRANGNRRCTCSALRGYFRFLQMQGVAIGNLLAAVPAVRGPRHAVKARWLTPADVKKLLNSVDRSKAHEKRNYAAMLCMVHLGLRASDVVRLSLDDIDWREGTVRVANHKPDWPDQLPLPRQLGKALADYLVKGRPTSSRREIFLCHRTHRGEPLTIVGLRGVMRKAWWCAGLNKKFGGTHILRHSAATRMRQKGADIKSIADVLGHHSITTTALYAQIDLPVLRAVAQPWPEVRT